MKNKEFHPQDDPKLPGDGGKVSKPNGMVVDSIPGDDRGITLCEINLSS